MEQDWGTSASRGGREPEREERGRGCSEGLKGEETIFVFCFEIYKAVVEMQKLVISLPLPLADQWLEINDCIAVLCTTPRSHHSEKANYKQSLCLGRKKENSSLVFKLRSGCHSPAKGKTQTHSAHTLNRKRLY